MARPAKAPARTQAPAWTREQLIACTDGPYTGQWFTAADWHTRLTAAQRMAEAGQRRSPALDYVVASTATIAHPTHDVLGHAAHHQAAQVGKEIAA